MTTSFRRSLLSAPLPIALLTITAIDRAQGCCSSREDRGSFDEHGKPVKRQRTDRQLKSTLSRFGLRAYDKALVARGITAYVDLEAKCMPCIGDTPKEDPDDFVTDMVVSSSAHCLVVIN